MRLHIPRLLVVIALLCSGTALATGDWPELRQNPRLTALQPAPGAMAAPPAVMAEYDLGRGQAPITPVPIEDGHVGLSIVAGTLYSHDTTGALRWQSHPAGLNFETLVRVDDFDGDGAREALLQAGRPASPYAAAVLVDFETGALKWRYDVEPMSYQWYLYAGNYLPGRTDSQIFVVMMGYPPDPLNGYCALFAWDGPGAEPVQQWRYDFSEYTCFPGFLKSDLDGDGVQEFVIQTHSRMWYLDAVTGALKHFAKWDVSPANVRSYGLTRFLDLNGDGRDDFLCIANFAQHHEVLLNQDGAMVKAWHQGWEESVTTGKVATTWAEPPQCDLDGDGRLEIVLSMYNSEDENAWLTRVYDAIDGTLKFRFPGVVALRTHDVDGDGKAEILGNASTDPTRNRLDSAQVLAVREGVLAEIWRDDAARVTEASGAPVLTVAGESRQLSVGADGTFALAPLPPAPPAAPGPDFSNVPALQGPPMPVLLAANLSGGAENELLVYREPELTVLRLENGAFTEVGRYQSACAPAIADFNGDGHLDLALSEVSPTALPTVRVVTPGLNDQGLWSLTLPEPGRTGLPQPRRAYLRTIHLTGKTTPDLYFWAGTPVVRSAGIDGQSGTLLWDKGEGPKERYWGASVNQASAWDYNGDGKEDLVFTNPDYYCVADGPTGEALHGPDFPPEIFKQSSQGLYTYPALLERAGDVPVVALVGGHYFQGGMSLKAEPYWYQSMTPGPNRTGNEAFFQSEGGAWRMGFGRQNGAFACVDALSGAVRWELPLEATASDVVAGDVDGDGQQEFVFGTSHGQLVALGEGDGGPREVWRVDTGVALGGPILADLDGDGKVEIACGAADGRVRIFGAAPKVAAHPRLYFTEEERVALMARDDEVSKKIWTNLIASAEWCLAKTPRGEYIAPVADDPIYENLYDRFYAMMMDMAIMEHLAFAYGIGREAKYGDAARDWALASCRAWKPDADATPDGGKAYAVLRLLKGLAVAYDLAYDRFSEAERAEVVGMLRTTTDNYYRNYFKTPEKESADFHTHHATVEFASLGVVALALLDEAPEAKEWLDFTTWKFKEHLLPMGLAPDGAQVEGATFWASTMQYRLFYMDALRRVTGEDLFEANREHMKADLAFAQIAAKQKPGWVESDATVVFSPSYGQLDYYAPVLLALGRFYGDARARRLALWDETLGGLQQTRYITRSGEQLLFGLGGYAALWHDPAVDVSGASDTTRHYLFPSVGEAYARQCWSEYGTVTGIKKTGEVIVHTWGFPVLVSGPDGAAEEAKSATIEQREADGVVTMTRSLGNATTDVKLHGGRVEARWSGRETPLVFHARQQPQVEGNALQWNRIRLTILEGELVTVEPEGYVPEIVVGMGKLKLEDPMPRAYPRVTVNPVEGRIVIEVGRN